MSLSECTLDREFDILGTWYRDGETLEEGVKGKLHYGSSSIVLDLYDSFSEGMKEFACIYGYSTQGKLLILHHCLPVSEDASSLGFAVESYLVDTFYLLDVKGEIPIEAPFSEVKSLQFSLNHLHRWINTRFTTLAFDLERSEQQHYPVPAQGITISVGVAHRRKRKKTTIVLEESYFLEITTENTEAKSFDSFFNDAALVKKLLEFLSSSPLEFDYVEFVFTQGKGRYFFKQTEKQMTHQPKNILTLDQIDNEFAGMLDQWFLKEDEFDLMIDNYLNDLYLDYYIETKLVNSIRNLEIYYRNFVRDPHYIEERKEALKADQKLLLEFVEHKVSEKHKQHFIRNILYIGEESLRVKLNDLIRNLPEALFTACIKQEDKSPSNSRSSFINKLMETRNFYTHGDEAEKYPDRLIGQKDYLLFNEKLKLFQRYYIYKELGLSEELILAILLPEAGQLEEN